jgi:hypothetical protein
VIWMRVSGGHFREFNQTAYGVLSKTRP